MKYKYKHEYNTANISEQKCLCIYLRSTTITYDHGNELLGHGFKIFNKNNKGYRKRVQLWQIPRKIQYYK